MVISAFKNYKYLLLTLAVVYFEMPLYAGRTTINVKSQVDFDRLQETFDSVVDAGKNDIRIVFSRGDYVAKESHFVLHGIDDPKLRVRIIGNGAVLRPNGHVYYDGDVYAAQFSTERSWMSGDNDLDIWSQVQFADGLIEVVDEGENLCRIKSREQLYGKSKLDNAYILIPQSYLSSVYKIIRVEGRYIYFVANNLARRGNSWNVNHDYHFGRASIRYKTSNFDDENDHLKIVDGKVRLPKGVVKAREGTMHRYFSFEKCNLREVSITGLKIKGNCNVAGGAAILFNQVKCGSCKVTDCSFRGLHSDAIRITASQNVVIKKCLFEDCYLYCVYSDNMSANTKVVGNTFERSGKAMMNTLCIRCAGEDFVIRDNLLKDFSHGGIGAGVWYLSKKSNRCSGLIVNNELYYTPAYIAEKHQHGLMDAGAIYLWTKNDGVCIKNNYIHDIDGMCANRGIFCDDGAYNFEIVGNVIVRIYNGNCIDSRLVESVENTQAKGSGIAHSNVNITMRDNLVDGKILFVGNPSVKDNNCVLGTNFLLNSLDDQNPVCEIKNVQSTGDLITVRQVGFSGAQIEMEGTAAKMLKKSSEWHSIRKHVKIRK